MAHCGFMPPQALLTISTSAAQRLHHAHRERDLLERLALVEVEAAFHRHDRFAGELAADQLPLVDRCGAVREVRDLLVGNDRLGRDVLGQPAEAGAEDDAGGGCAGPLRANGGRGFLDLVERVMVVMANPGSGVA